MCVARDDSARRGAEAEEQQRKAARVWTVPNLICMARMAATPGIAWLLVSGQHELALYGFIIAGISDGLDGLIARRFDQKSVLGSYLDPISDKLLINSLALACAADGLVHPGVVALIFARDAILVIGTTVIGRLFARGADHQEKGGEGAAWLIGSSPLEIKASALSKANTVLQLTLLTTAMAGAAFPGIETLALSVVPPLSALTATTTFLSLLDYARRPGLA